MAESIEEVKKEVRAYIAVFAALAVFTVLTVIAAYVHFIYALGIVIGLLIATFKASLVALFFMHLKAERKFIYWSLVLTVFFFVALVFLPLWAYWDHLHNLAAARP